MYTSLGPGDIGIDSSFPDAAALAADNGFDAIQVDVQYLRDHGPAAYRDVLDEHGLRTGSIGLPVDVTGDEEDYEADLDELRDIAEQAADIDCTRCSTYIWSGSDERPFEENFEFHRERLEPVAEVLSTHGIRLGLEYLGPQSLREGHEYDFVHDAEGMLELCSVVDPDAVGLLLDSWHWHTAGETVNDLQSLDADDVVDVHVNDAPRGLSPDQYVDTERALPGETGVIDIEGFLGHLDDIGYEGPVMAEPFSDDLNEMDDDDAARETALSLETVWRQAGL